MYKYLSLLPAVLSFTAFVIYLLNKRNKQSSGLVQSIIDTIQSKSSETIKLDDRLSARQVFTLVNEHPDFREKLNDQDYQLLANVLKAEQRKNFGYGILTLILVVVSLFAYYKIEEYQNTLEVSNLQIQGIYENQPKSLPTTRDDLKLKWSYDGKPKEISLSLSTVDQSKTTERFKCLVQDGEITIPNSSLEEMWECPDLGDILSIRVHIQTEKKSFTFGPFEIHSALTILHFMNVENNELEVFTQTQNCGLTPFNYELTAVAWSKNGRNTESINLQVVGGKVKRSFPADFQVDLNTLKFVYLGNTHSKQVRFKKL